MKPATEILWSAAFALTPREHWWNGTTREHIAVVGCAYVAICTAAEELAPKAFKERLAALDAANQAAGGGVDQIIAFNDTHTHEEVLGVLYKAAEIAEAS